MCSFFQCPSIDEMWDRVRWDAGHLSLQAVHPGSGDMGGVLPKAQGHLTKNSSLQNTCLPTDSSLPHQLLAVLRQSHSARR